MEKRMFTFTVAGQYYGSHGQTGLAIIKTYEATFRLPTIESALSTIVRYLLEPYLIRNYGDYARFRTHKIIGMSYTGRPANSAVLQMAFDDMQVQDLADFCILKQIFIDPYQHRDLEKCRNEIQRLYQSRLDQKKQDEKSGQAKKQKEIDELLKMNELPPLDTSLPNVNMQKISSTMAKVQGADGKIHERVGYEAPAGRRAAMPEPQEPMVPAAQKLGPGMVLEEEPVNNDPALTAKAFEPVTPHLVPEENDIFA